MDDYDRATQRENDMQLVRRERERRSLDTIRIFNPLDFPFKYQWDSRPFTVRAKSTDEVERYRAEAYAKKIITYMIGQQALVKGKELLELRQQQFGRSFLDKYEENKEVWDRVPRLDDQHLIQELGEVVVLGMVREYGVEEAPDRDTQPIEKQETPYDSLFKRMDRKILDPLDSMGEDITV